MSAQTDKRFDEWVKWYVNNVQRIPIVDPKMQWDFLTKAMAGLIEITDQLRQDVEVLEGRRSRLYRPIGLKVSGDVRTLG